MTAEQIHISLLSEHVEWHLYTNTPKPGSSNYWSQTVFKTASTPSLDSDLLVLFFILIFSSPAKGPHHHMQWMSHTVFYCEWFILHLQRLSITCKASSCHYTLSHSLSPPPPLLLSVIQFLTCLHFLCKLTFISLLSLHCCHCSFFIFLIHVFTSVDPNAFLLSCCSFSHTSSSFFCLLSWFIFLFSVFKRKLKWKLINCHPRTLVPGYPTPLHAFDL